MKEYLVFEKNDVGHYHIKADGFILDDNGDILLYQGKDMDAVAAFKEWSSIREVVTDECSDLNELTN